MSDLSMVKARENFFNYKNGIISPNHPAIFHLPEFKYPESYTESERQVVFNNFQSQFANFFGVPVNKLSLFLSSMEAEYEKYNKYVKLSREVQSPSNWDDKFERITIKCSGNMCSWAGSGESLSLWTRIGGEALSRGLDNGERFFVDYYRGDTLVNTESWRSYGASGAHFEREVSRPCPTCPFH